MKRHLFISVGLALLLAVGCRAPTLRETRIPSSAPPLWTSPAPQDPAPEPALQDPPQDETQEEKRSRLQRLIAIASPRVTATMDPNQGASSVQMDSEMATEEELAAATGEWFVAPIPFLNAQLGFGLVLAGGYIFAPDRGIPRGRKSMVGAGVVWAEFVEAGVAGLSHYTPNWKFQLAGAGGELSYDFFGIGTGGGESGNSIRLDSQFLGTHAKTLYYLGKGYYFGPTATWAIVDTKVSGSAIPPPDQNDLEDENVLLGLRGEHDSRDSEFFPTSGDRAELTADFASSRFGGARSFQKYGAEFAMYHGSAPSGPVLAWHVKSQFADGNAPFYVFPSHNLRGYLNGRYRDDFWLAGEVEYRHPLSKSFNAVAFAGLGGVASKPADLDADDLLPSVGVGLRYRLTKKNPLYYRLDVGVGRDEAIVYLSVGEAF